MSKTYEPRPTGSYGEPDYRAMWQQSREELAKARAAYEESREKARPVEEWEREEHKKLIDDLRGEIRKREQWLSDALRGLAAMGGR